MSKSKSKNRNEVEHLRGIIRRLKAQLKYYKRRAHIPEDDILLEDEEVELQANCENCGKGIIIQYDFKYVILERCDTCGNEKRTKKDR